jgi:hypothetical protein
MRRSVAPKSVLQALARSRFLILFVCLLGLFMAVPMVPRGHGFSVLDLDVAVSTILIASVWSLNHSRLLVAVGLAFVVPAITATIFARAGSSPTLGTVGLGCALAFMAFTAGSVLWVVVRAREVDTDTVLGGICVYLLLAAFWAGIYSLLARLDPGSFSAPQHPFASSSGIMGPEFIYYSVLIITTMGPEEVEPLTGPARAWTGLEAIAGQLFLAVFIARLVGMHASQPHKRE